MVSRDAESAERSAPAKCKRRNRLAKNVNSSEQNVPFAPPRAILQLAARVPRPQNSGREMRRITENNDPLAPPIRGAAALPAISAVRRIIPRLARKREILRENCPLLWRKCAQPPKKHLSPTTRRNWIAASVRERHCQCARADQGFRFAPPIRSVTPRPQPSFVRRSARLTIFSACAFQCCQRLRVGVQPSGCCRQAEAWTPTRRLKASSS